MNPALSIVTSSLFINWLIFSWRTETLFSAIFLSMSSVEPITSELSYVNIPITSTSSFPFNPIAFLKSFLLIVRLLSDCDTFGLVDSTFTLALRKSNSVFTPFLYLASTTVRLSIEFCRLLLFTSRTSFKNKTL